MRFVTCLIACLIASPAFAQAPQPSPEMMALQAKVMEEINSNISCKTQFIALQQKEAALTAQLKAMKDKYEPEKKPEAKKP